MQSNLNPLDVPDEPAVVNWLAQKPRTYGWDMWVAMDRSTVNRSLLLDYIERFDTHPLGSALTGEAMTQENLRWEHLYGLRFNAPELSFTNSSITSDRVEWSSRAIAGMQLTVDQPSGAAKRIVKIESFSPLQGPLLSARTILAELSNAPDATAAVHLDVAKGDQFRFSFAETAAAQIVGGDFLEKVFGLLPPIRRQAVINHVMNRGKDTLTPAEVRPRAFKAPGVAGENGGGGLLLYMSFPGSAAGLYPGDGSDWIYPIPAGYNMTVVASSYALMTRIVGNGVLGASMGAELEFDNADDNFLPVNTLRALAGQLKSTSIELSTPPFSEVSYTISPFLAEAGSGATPLHIERSASGVTINWRASSFNRQDAPSLATVSIDATSEVDYAFRLRTTLDFTATDEGSLGLAPVGGAPTWATSVYRQGGLLDPAHYQYFPSLSSALNDGVALAINELWRGQGPISAQFDLFRDSGFFFPGDLRLHADSVHVPDDLAIFGRVASKLDCFEVEPLQSKVLAGGTVKFRLSPARESVEWTVEPVDGFGSEVGSISSTGEYLAPSAGSLEGSFTLVRVTAASGGKHSSALVAVVPQDVLTNPLVFSTWPKGGETRVAAGCLDGGGVEWEVQSVTGATLQKPPLDSAAIFDPNDRLYVPGPVAGERFFSVDKIVARNPRTGVSHTTSALVVEKVVSAEIVIREGVTLPPNQIQFDFKGSLGPIEGATWEVAIGGGTIDDTGLYTMDAAAQGFAVITAWFSAPPVAELFNYRVLPLPLIELKELSRILS